MARMTEFSSFPASGAEPDASKLAALRRAKVAATASLVLCFVIFLLARFFENRSPVLGFVAAFTEAATIGGLADWYAVVALFKRPLGLPIPHTAIIPRNQERIADNLGRFVEANFLAAEPVKAKLAEVDFAALVSDWLADKERADALSAFLARLIPQTLDAIEGSGLRDFVSKRFSEQFDKVDVAPLAADLLTAFTADRRHQKLFDQFTKALGKFLSDEDSLAIMREKIREELPSLFKVFRADAFLLKKIVGSADTLLAEIRSDPDHPLRREFDEFVQAFIVKLRKSKDYRKRAEKLKRDFLARPELSAMAHSMWQSFRLFLEKDASSSKSIVRQHLSHMLVEVGRHLATDEQVRAEMNRGFVVALASFVESQKSGVSTFIAAQVKSWDLGQLVRLIEANVGRDLQYIRFNGMIVGGLAGLALHMIELIFLAG